MYDMTRFKKQIEFIVEIDKLKTVFRQNYLTDATRKENDTEHSWHLAVMAAVLAEYAPENVDITKVIIMVLFHDMVEVYAGDTFAYDTDGIKTQHQREVNAANKLFSMLPDDQRDEYIALWREFEQKQTPEAEFANILDRIQPCLLNYTSHGKSWLEHGVKAQQVRNRNSIVFDYGEPFDKLMDYLITAATEEGLLKNE